MAYAGTPVVRNQHLHLPNSSHLIRLDTAAWRTWLTTATSFYYRPSNPLEAFTVRKEKRRHSWYWYAYLKMDSKLHNAYVGRSEAVTTARLTQVAQSLQEKLRRYRRQQLAKGDNPLIHSAR
jgi:hypothetical protein